MECLCTAGTSTQLQGFMSVDKYKIYLLGQGIKVKSKVSGVALIQTTMKNHKFERPQCGLGSFHTNLASGTTCCWHYTKRCDMIGVRSPV